MNQTDQSAEIDFLRTRIDALEYAVFRKNKADSLRDEVWFRLQDGCSSSEIAAWAGVSEEVARGMIFEAIPGNAEKLP